MAVAAVALPLIAGACGDDASSGDTLPPIHTTTTTTTLNVTTTTILLTYDIQSGDSLGKIAATFGVSIDELMALNGITDPDHIEVGQTLKIPPPLPTTTLPASSTSAGATSSTGG
jgi:LysM repeat protein